MASAQEAAAAAAAERLFSLELLVDWVSLETRLLPPPPPAAEDAEEAGPPPPPPPADSLRLAVAFRLLDFPTLLVYPPGGPAAASGGRFPFGRGKSCLFRLDAAALQRLLGLCPLYALLLTVPPGSPTPAPRLVGSCGISLMAAARGLSASGGSRGLYALTGLMGEPVGHISLGYRLTDLGSTLLDRIPPKPPGGSRSGDDPAGARVHRMEGTGPGEGSPTAPPHGSFAPADPEALEDVDEAKRQEGVIEVVTRGSSKPKPRQYVVKVVKTCSSCSDTDSSGSDTGTETPEDADSDLETNIICPPPLYYSHLEPKKVPPAKGKVLTVPQVSVSREWNEVALKEKAPCPLGRDHDVPSDEIQEAMAPSPPDPESLFDQDKLDKIRQLPLLNALLVELSLLYNQPLAAATNIHPHLAWLYRPEERKAPEPSNNASEEVGDKFLPRKTEEVQSPPVIRNQAGHSLRRGVCLDKSRSIQKKVVARKKLFYGLTNTLKLRLKRTNPNMLILHEKREQYRKMQTEMPDVEKLEILSSKGKRSTEKYGKPHALPINLCSASDVLFAENIKTLRPDGVASEDSTKETQVLGTGTEREIKVKIKANRDSSIKTVNKINPILPEKITPRNVSETSKKEVKVHLLEVDTENTRIDSTGIGFSNGINETVSSDFRTPNSKDITSGKNSLSESIPELKYSDDFTSPCYSEDFFSADDNFESSRVHSCVDTDCKSNESRMSRKSHKSEMNSILTPPFSAGSPVHSYKKSHLSKSQAKSLMDANSISSDDLSSQWSERKKKQDDQNNTHNSEMRNTGTPDKLNPRNGQKSFEKSQSLRTSQVSSYLPSNMSELELNALDSNTSDQFEENDELGSLDIGKQYKDICELVINKLPGYTV